MKDSTKKSLPAKGYRGPYERHKSQLEDNGAEIMMHGDEVYLREWGQKGWSYTHWPAKRAVLLYTWFAAHIDELRELAGADLPTPLQQQTEPIDPESFAGLLGSLTEQMKALSDDLDQDEEAHDHPLNTLLQSWLVQLQLLKTWKPGK